jgi:hypothetical protein
VARRRKLRSKADPARDLGFPHIAGHRRAPPREGSELVLHFLEHVSYALNEAVRKVVAQIAAVAITGPKVVRVGWMPGPLLPTIIGLVPMMLPPLPACSAPPLIMVWLSVGRKVAFGLCIAGVASGERREIVRQDSQRVGLLEAINKRPHELPARAKQLEQAGLQLCWTSARMRFACSWSVWVEVTGVLLRGVFWPEEAVYPQFGDCEASDL